MYCKECGSKLNESSLFCTKCGMKVEKNVVNNVYNNNNNGLKTASIVLGVIGIVLGIFLGVIGFIISLIGLILGICALKKGKNVLGIVLNSVGLLIAVTISILIIIGAKYIFNTNIENNISNEVSDYNYDFDSIDLDILYENDIPIESVLNRVDKIILDKVYPEDEDMINTVNETAEEYYSLYEEYYEYTKEDFLLANGFDTEEEFIDFLNLDYRRNQYFEDYTKGLITEEEINKYYDEKVFGDVNSKHILVKLDSDYTEGERINAENFAFALIEQLNSGKSFDEVKEEFKDYITYEELGYRAFNAPLEETYLEECKNLEIGEYSKIPIQTYYGYHIVYKIDQKEKPSLSEVQDDIVSVLADQKQNEDANLYNKALINMREEAGFNFKNTVYEYQYEKYIELYQ